MDEPEENSSSKAVLATEPQYLGWLEIFCNALLPGAHALEVIRRARAFPHRRRTPVVMLAAGEWEMWAWRAGVDAFLRKPEGVGAVVGIVRRLLTGKG